MKKFLLGVLVTILLFVGALAYIGIVPILSVPFNKPRDLGIKANPQLVYDFEKQQSLMAKEGKVDLNVSLDSEMVTSVFAVWQQRNPNYPFDKVQVRFNPDGTGEIAGIVKLPVIVNLAKKLGYNDNDINKGKEYVQFVNGNLPFYAKGVANVKNNQININPTEFNVGKVSVPNNISQPLKSVVIDMIERRLNQIGGANIRDFNFADGKMHLNATVPATIKY